jgi:hypothetical protein
MLTRILLLLTIILLTACGGGGGGGAAPSESNPPSEPVVTSPAPAPPPPPPPPPAPAPTGTSVTLNWTAPSTRENGDPISASEIGGYEIYYFADGTPSGSGTVIDINDVNTTTYTTAVLPSGRWYFSLATYDTNGLYSNFSTPSSVDIP